MRFHDPDSDDHPVDVIVHFAGRTGPVSGTVTPDGVDPKPFHGWLELMDVLESSRGEVEVRLAAPPRSGEGLS